MSSYLGFKKNGTVLCWFSRSTKLYEAFDSCAPYGEWKTVTKADLLNGIEELKDDEKSTRRLIDINKEMIQHGLNYEELFEIISSTKDMEEEIEKIKAAIANIYLLIDILDEYGKDSKMEWIVS